MQTFTKEILVSLANLSALKLDEQEMEIFLKQIKSVINYIDELAPVVIKPVKDSIRNVNIFRDDVAFKTDTTPLLEQAPETDEGYFTVPKILDEK